MPKPAGHASIHTHEVSYTTLPIPLRLGLSDTPVSALSALLEAKAPPSFLPSFTLDLGYRQVRRCLICFEGATIETLILTMAQQATTKASLSSPPFILFVVTGFHIAKGHIHMIKSEDRGWRDG